MQILKLGKNFMENDSVLITGASDGIGFETVKIFLKKKYHVIAHYHDKPKKLTQIRSKNLHLIQYNFEDTYNLKSFVRKCSQNFDVGILINNAAFYHYDKSPNDIEIKTIEKYLNINLVTPYILCQEFSKNMITRREGKIINISSISTKHGGSINSSFYTITKSGLEQMTRTLAKSYAKFNINTIALRIGVTNTKFHEKNPGKDLNKRAKLIPLHRIADPKEIANIIYLFTTEALSYCTGTVIDIAGGE